MRFNEEIYEHHHRKSQRTDKGNVVIDRSYYRLAISIRVDMMIKEQTERARQNRPTVSVNAHQDVDTSIAHNTAAVQSL